MISYEVLSHARSLFSEGKSITSWLREEGIELTQEIIGMVYELQAGTYSRIARENTEFVKEFTSEIAAGIKNLPGFGQVSTILDCGTGEGTTLLPLVMHLDFKGNVLAFDGSLSRVSWAKENSRPLDNFKFFAANTSNIPLQDNSIDLVLSVHSLEPNGGREDELLLELARVSSRYVVLVEPDFESSSETQQIRMTELGYIKGLREAVKKADLTIVGKKQMISAWNPDNVASLWLCQKKAYAEQKAQKSSGNVDGRVTNPEWVDPVSREALEPFRGSWKSSSGIAYPVVNGIPILRPEDGIMFLSPPDFLIAEY